MSFGFWGIEIRLGVVRRTNGLRTTLTLKTTVSVATLRKALLCIALTHYSVAVVIFAVLGCSSYLT